MGCSDNVGFGINFATQFLHRKHTEWRHGDTGEWRRGNSGDWDGPTEGETEVLLHNLRVAAEVRCTFIHNVCLSTHIKYS